MIMIMMMMNKLYKKIKIKLMTKDKYIEYLRLRGVKIGINCDIDKRANFGSEPWLIQLGDNVRITKGVEFITHDGGLWTLRKMGVLDKESVKYGNIRIENNCNISWNVIIMPNVCIGKNSVIAAGAVVTKNVPNNSVWGGVPAKMIETIETYHSKISGCCVPTFSMSEHEKKQYLLKNNTELFSFNYSEYNKNDK